MLKQVKVLALLCLVALLVVSLPLSSWAKPLQSELERGKKFAKGELLVKFNTGMTESVKSASHRAKGSKKIKQFKSTGIHHVKLSNGMTVEKALAKYRNDPAVEYAEPNYIVTPAMLPDDPSYPDQWGLISIDAAGAWNLETGDPTYIVGVLDTGIDYNHPDLAANVWVNTLEQNGLPGVDDDANGYVDDIYGIDTFDADSDPYPADGSSHGTHVAGIIGAVGNNGQGVSGVNWNVQTLSCRCMNASGGPVSGMIECMEYVKALKDRGEPIVTTNNSYGSPYSTQSEKDTISALGDIIFVAAAGNNSTDNDHYPYMPASYGLPNIISVGATHQNDNMAFNFGERSVHVGAPGVSILSTVPGNGYASKSGTSMASPFVAGLVALIKADDPTRSWSEVRNLVLSGGNPTGYLADNTISGRRINALGSLTCTDQPVFSALEVPKNYTPGTPETLTALSINCENPVGPVTVNASGGAAVTLLDDGVFPDLEAGDGIFTGDWTPTMDSELLTFSSPSGSHAIRTPLLQLGDPRAFNGQIGVAYSWTFSATGGLPPYNWSATNNALPPGLSLDTGTGEISGTPTVEGDFSFTMEATDLDGVSNSREIDITVIGDDIIERWTAAEPMVGTNMAIDQKGNIYVTGYGHDQMGGLTTDYQTAKYDKSGGFYWSQEELRSYDSGFEDHGQDVAVASDGDIFVTGTSDVGFLADWVTLRYSDLDGSNVWPTPATFDGGGTLDNAYAIAYDEFGGAVYVTGSSANDLIINKYDSLTGTPLWFQPLTVSGGEARDLAVDFAGTLYVTGSISNGSDLDYWTMAYDSDGNPLWPAPSVYDSGYDDFATALAVLPSQQILVTGYSYNGTDYDTATVKYDGIGVGLWSSPAIYDSGMDDKAYGIASNQFGDKFYVVGSTGPSSSSNYLLTAHDDFSGTLKWSYQYGQGLGFTANAIVVGYNNYIYITGDAGTVALEVVLHVTTNWLPTGRKAVPYSYNLSAMGGDGPYLWSLESGALPPGLSLSDLTGSITGAPTLAGSFDFSVRVEDAFGAAVKPVTIVINDTLDIVTASLAQGNEGVSYAETLVGSGGMTPYTWSITAGALPPGLSLDSNNGTISGTPTSAGNYDFTIELSDKQGYIALQALSINVEMAPNNPPVAEANGPYAGDAGQSVSFSSAGSSDPDGDAITYLWDFGDGNQSTDANPAHTYATAGSYTVTLTVTDPSSDTGVDTATATIAVAANQPPVADAGPDQTAKVRAVVTFDGNGSTDQDGSIVSYSWNYGDGKGGSGAVATHQYKKAGTYTATLTVTDNQGATDVSSALITITR